jgi:hypothetical protein
LFLDVYIKARSTREEGEMMRLLQTGKRELSVQDSQCGGAVIPGVLDVRPTDPVIELRRQARELSWRHPKQRLDLVRG